MQPCLQPNWESQTPRRWGWSSCVTGDSHASETQKSIPRITVPSAEEALTSKEVSCFFFLPLLQTKPPPQVTKFCLPKKNGHLLAYSWRFANLCKEFRWLLSLRVVPQNSAPQHARTGRIFQEQRECLRSPHFRGKFRGCKRRPWNWREVSYTFLWKSTRPQTMTWGKRSVGAALGRPLGDCFCLVCFNDPLGGHVKTNKHDQQGLLESFFSRSSQRKNR